MQTALADIDQMLPLDERVLFFRWGARMRTDGPYDAGYGILIVTTGRVYFTDSIAGAAVRISDIVEYGGSRGSSWAESRNSYLKITARGSTHNFYFESDKTSAIEAARAIGKAKISA